MTENICTECREVIVEGDTDLIEERNEQGKSRMYRTQAELCKKCRSKQFWAEWDRKADR